MSKPAYRPATLNDIPIIVDFQIAMALETEGISLNREVCAAGVRQVFERSALGRYYVGEKDGRVVAALMITYEWSDWRNGEIWWLQSVYVPADHRGRGVFRTLFEAVRREAETTPGIVGLRLYVEEHNQAARGVYDRLGMRESGYLVLERMLGEA